MIMKEKDYVLESGYHLNTITGKDKKGLYFYICVFYEKGIVEKCIYRDTKEANEKFKELRKTYQNVSVPKRSYDDEEKKEKTEVQKEKEVLVQKAEKQWNIERTAQISLFDEANPFMLQESFSKEILHLILQYGSNERNSRMIVTALYMKKKTIKEIAKILPLIYHGGYGICYKGQEISAWYGEDGIHLHKGTAAQFIPTAQVISWETVAEIIRDMLEQGTFTIQAELEEALYYDRKELVQRLSYLMQDFSEDIRNAGFLECMKIENHMSFDEKETYITDKLIHDQEFVCVLQEEYQVFQQNYAKNPEILRFHFHKVEQIGRRIEELLYPIQQYQSSITVLQKVSPFITEDEIDNDFIKYASGIENGKSRIYTFFLESHTTKEKEEFLKKEFGCGGYSHALSNEMSSGHWHDSKGICYTKGDCVKILLKWSQVVKRIERLIKENRYFVPKEFKDKPQGILIGTEQKEQESSLVSINEKQEKTVVAIKSVVEKDTKTKETSSVDMETNIKSKTINKLMPVKRLEDFIAVNYQNLKGTPFPVGTKAKCKANLNAIQLLQTLEFDGDRQATAEEQKILAQYSGWGGLADVFDERKTEWAEEFVKLRAMLTKEEYASAKESTLNAYYTSSTIISAMYMALANMGFQTGNILEPSMGIGNFFGMLPVSMNKSKLYGVELDSISGRIAKKLYPSADIQICGFEHTAYPNDFFDVVIGNIPFGQYQINDKAYQKYHFLVHDYFLAKAIDKVRPGGVVFCITTKGTLDKKDTSVREYIASRAELLGAIRLPNNAFLGAGTEVTADILFLQKREHLETKKADWLELGETDTGIPINQYFVNHPEMILGQMKMVSGPYGMHATCIPKDEQPLKEVLYEAVSQISGNITAIHIEEDSTVQEGTIPADPAVKNFSYTLISGQIYFRENSVMYQKNVSDMAKKRIMGMIALRDCTYALINLQLDGESNAVIEKQQQELNHIYDDFVKKYGRICTKGNQYAFEDDSSYFLLSSLEILDDEGNFLRKADMFFKRTINQPRNITHVDTALDALAVSLNEKAEIDITYMSALTNKKQEEIVEELQGLIFQNPVTEKWEPADEYLSGNVREKLEVAKAYVEQKNNIYLANVAALEQVQPKMLEASEIEVQLGATWVEDKYIDDFMIDIFKTPPQYIKNGIQAHYSSYTSTWKIEGKNLDINNPITETTYGTDRCNAYYLLETALNLKDAKVYDIEYLADGTKKRILNEKETILATTKQDMIKEEFRNWIFSNQARRQELCEKYNKLYNAHRPRMFDGSHLQFHGMNPDIQLYDYQKNAIARILYGKNTLLAHCVGAGKTFELTAGAMELKYLGLCNKSMFVVPNHLIEQWACDFLRLYPGAKVLATTKKDFAPKNRKRFCSRIATGEYDAIIIGHSQFEKIPLSVERQMEMLERQIEELEVALQKAEGYTVKRLEQMKKNLKIRLEQLHDQSKKDDIVTFEQLGVDRLFVDESHLYKNLYFHTKMNNVAGIPQTEAKKSSDMFAKCQYIDEITNGSGITFASGTPISNSMTEMYTNMRYLQYDMLKYFGWTHFDSWASTFGKVEASIELAPEGTGYRAKTRFAKFYNLPELVSLFKESADIQTAEMLQLPRPTAVYENVLLQPSDLQIEEIENLGIRADDVRQRRVDANIDNLLNITNDGRKLALDQRLMCENAEESETSKVHACAENALRIWNETKEEKGTQLIFCDLSTPKNDGSFNVYDAIKQKLLLGGVPKEEIAYIHDANTDAKKAALFAKVRAGKVRFLFGSTAKMGAGTNVQQRLIALHHLDIPWRPSDLEQREGRILRQGNQNEKVYIFRYVTKQTFDSYSWQIIENKQRFIGQIMTDKSPVRSADDVDEATLNYAEIKALSTGNPLIQEKTDLDMQVSKLKLLKNNYYAQKYNLEDKIAKFYPQEITKNKKMIEGMTEDIQTYGKNYANADIPFSIEIHGMTFKKRSDAGNIILQSLQKLEIQETQEIGSYAGFQLIIKRELIDFYIILKGMCSYQVLIEADAVGSMIRMENCLKGLSERLNKKEEYLRKLEHDFEIAKKEVKKPFVKENELSIKLARLAEVNAMLDMGTKSSQSVSVSSAKLEQVAV